MFLKFSKSIILWVVVGIFLTTALLSCISGMLPYSRDEISKSIVIIDHQYNYTIKSNGSPLLYFEGVTKDSLFKNPSLEVKTNKEQSYGCWVNSSSLIPSCKGRIATVSSSIQDLETDNSILHRIARNTIERINRIIDSYEHSMSEVNYYISTHNYSDEGYAQVISYNDSLKSRRNQIEKLLDVLKIVASNDSCKVESNETYVAEFKDEQNNSVRKRCILISSSYPAGNTLLQLCDSITPKGITALNLRNIMPLNLNTLKDTVFIYGNTYYNEKDRFCGNAEIIPEYISGDTLLSSPKVNIINGSLVFTRGGIFIGITGEDMIINRTVIRKSF